VGAKPPDTIGASLVAAGRGWRHPSFKCEWPAPGRRARWPEIQEARCDRFLRGVSNGVQLETAERHMADEPAWGPDPPGPPLRTAAALQRCPKSPKAQGAKRQPVAEGNRPLPGAGGRGVARRSRRSGRRSSCPERRWPASAPKRVRRRTRRNRHGHGAAARPDHEAQTVSLPPPRGRPDGANAGAGGHLHPNAGDLGRRQPPRRTARQRARRAVDARRKCGRCRGRGAFHDRHACRRGSSSPRRSHQGRRRVIVG
jgi:hypothetical protein